LAVRVRCHAWACHLQSVLKAMIDSSGTISASIEEMLAERAL
jgi:uncharacterized membrane protein